MRRFINLGIVIFLGFAACTTQSPLPTRAVAAVVPPALTAVSSPQFTPISSPTDRPIPTIMPQPSPTPSPMLCASSGRIETGTFDSQIGGPMAYRVYLPPCYGENGRTYPTLYMLPGNNQTDAIWDSLGLDETAETAIQNNEIPPLIIVMPEGGWIALNSSGGPSSYESVIMDDLIPFVETTYCAWSSGNGRAIGGVSRGGYWALEIAFRHPTQFISVGGHSASLLDIAAGPDLNPQFTGLASNLEDLRIYLDMGENDGGIDNTRKLHEDFTMQGIPHTWILNSGGHNNIYWKAHLKEYLVWYGSGWSLMNNSTPDCAIK